MSMGRCLRRALIASGSSCPDGRLPGRHPRIPRINPGKADLRFTPPDLAPVLLGKALEDHGEEDAFLLEDHVADGEDELGHRLDGRGVLR
jgi:hypothetical protein